MVSPHQAEGWVSERMQKMVEESIANLTDLRAKMKLLQKHQVFEAEILAHEEIIGAVLQVRRDLLLQEEPLTPAASDIWESFLKHMRRPPPCRPGRSWSPFATRGPRR